MKTFAVYPYQKAIFIFEGKRELAKRPFENEEQKDEIVKELKALKIKQKNFFGV